MNAKCVEEMIKAAQKAFKPLENLRDDAVQLVFTVGLRNGMPLLKEISVWPYNKVIQKDGGHRLYSPWPQDRELRTRQSIL